MLGFIGRNGAGKSTLLKILTRITTHRGARGIRGRAASLLEVGTGFHPELTGRENVFLNGSHPRHEAARDRPEVRRDRRVRRGGEVHRHARQALLERDVRPTGLRRRRVSRARGPARRRSARGRRRRVPAAVPRAGWRTSSQSGRTVLFVSHNMQAIAQLCDRAYSLDGGQIVREGPSAEVVVAVPPGGPRAAARAAGGPTLDAPGDELVRLRRRACSRTERSRARSDVREPVGIEIAFTVLDDGRPVVPEDQGVDRQGDVAFNALDTSPRWREPATPGEYVSTAWIPGNLLNEGLISVDVAVVLARRHEVPPSRRPARCRCPSTSTTRARGTRRAGSSRTGARRRPAVARVELGRAIVGIVLVRNEDVFLEQAIRNVAGFCDRIHAVDHVSTDGTWEVLCSSSSASYDHLDVRRARARGRLARAGRALRGHGDVGVRCRRRRAVRPGAARGLSRRAARRARTATSSRSPRTSLNCVALDREARYRHRLPLAALAVDHEALQLRRDRVVGGDGAERLHGGTIVFRDGYDESAVDNIGERLSWDETPLRCLHACFLRRSSGDPEAHGASRGRPILEETGDAGPRLRGCDSKRLCAGSPRRQRPPGSWRSTCAATSSRSTRRRFSAERVALRCVEPVLGSGPRANSCARSTRRATPETSTWPSRAPAARSWRSRRDGSPLVLQKMIVPLGAVKVLIASSARCAARARRPADSSRRAGATARSRRRARRARCRHVLERAGLLVDVDEVEERLQQMPVVEVAMPALRRLSLVRSACGTSTTRRHTRASTRCRGTCSRCRACGCEAQAGTTDRRDPARRRRRSLRTTNSLPGRRRSELSPPSRSRASSGSVCDMNRLASASSSLPTFGSGMSSDSGTTA